MRKRMIDSHPSSPEEVGTDWLPLEQIASVEVTSEESANPIENALLSGVETGWRAGLAGEQTIRIIFDSPQHLQRIRLVFLERENERSQEFVLSWSPDSGKSALEIVRQQWNFSPNSSAQEIEDYHVDLSGVSQVELKIVPDRSGGEARASLMQFRLA
jgi:hypothetical protein